MTTDARLMILVRACGAPNPAKNEYGKLEVEVQKALDQTQLLFDSLMQQYFG